MPFLFLLLIDECDEETEKINFAEWKEKEKHISAKFSFIMEPIRQVAESEAPETQRTGARVHRAYLLHQK